MSDETAGPTDRCVCGHVRDHHRAYRGGAYCIACSWVECGCPSFIAEPVAASPERTETTA
jgi:hypothetical protein